MVPSVPGVPDVKKHKNKNRKRVPFSEIAEGMLLLLSFNGEKPALVLRVERRSWSTIRLKIFFVDGFVDSIAGTLHQKIGVLCNDDGRPARMGTKN